MKVSSVRNLIPVADGSGVTMTSSVVRYGSSTSGTTKPSTWSTSVPTVSQGNYLWSWIHMEFSNNTSMDIYSVSRMGIDGKGVKSSVVDYSQQNTSVDPATITDWGDYPSTLNDGYWLYTRTRLTYSDDATTTSYSVSQVGTGSYYAGLQEYYQAGTSSSVPDAAAPAKGTYASGQEITIDDNWKQERPTLTAEKPYLWNFEISADSKGNRYVTPAVCIGNFAKGISKIVETYGISAYSKPDKTDAKFPSDISSWTDEQQDAAPTEEKPYQWNRTETTYNDNSVEYHYHVSAVKGDKGSNAPRKLYILSDTQPDTPTEANPTGWSSVPLACAEVGSPTNDGTYPWDISNDFYISSNHVDGTTSSISFPVTASEDTLLMMYWAIGSESNYDKGHIYIDDVEISGFPVSGSNSGKTKLSISKGSHTLKISYIKDSSTSVQPDQMSFKFVALKQWEITEVLGSDGSWVSWSAPIGYGNDGADAIQPNLYGYNCGFNVACIVHTKTGFAGVMNGSDTSYNAQVYHFKDNVGTRFPAGTYALSCKVKVTSISGMPSSFEVFVGGDYFGSQTKTMTSGSIASFVVKGTCSATTVPWVCIGEYGNASSGITASAKFRIEVTEWKFEDASKIIGTNTKFNGLSDEKVTTRNNILRDALFNKSSLWTRWNGNCKHVDNLLDGQGGVVFSGVNLPANTPMYDILQQNLTGKLKPSTWYTLSYWAKFHYEDSNGKTLFRSYIYPSIGSTNDVCVQDDVVMNGRENNYHDVTTSDSLTSWKRHVITFRTPSTLPDYYQILWRLSNEDTVEHYREFSLCMPKLEECETATDFCVNEIDKRGQNGSSFNIMSWTDCIAAGSWTFYSSKEIADDTLVADIVIYNSYYYLCIEGYTATSSSSTPDNDSTHWKLFQNFSNIATNIILSNAIKTKILEAVNAKIDELVVKKLQTATNGARVVTEGSMLAIYGTAAFPNIKFGVDENGRSILIYYDSSGNKLYDLGPNGISYVSVREAKFVSLEGIYCTDFRTYVDENFVNNYRSQLFTASGLYRFFCQRVAGQMGESKAYDNLVFDNNKLSGNSPDFDNDNLVSGYLITGYAFYTANAGETYPTNPDDTDMNTVTPTSDDIRKGKSILEIDMTYFTISGSTQTQEPKCYYLMAVEY